VRPNGGRCFGASAAVRASGTRCRPWRSWNGAAALPIPPSRRGSPAGPTWAPTALLKLSAHRHTAPRRPRLLKRETNTPAPQVNNALGQALLACAMGKSGSLLKWRWARRLATATSALVRAECVASTWRRGHARRRRQRFSACACWEPGCSGDSRPAPSRTHSEPSAIGDQRGEHHTSSVSSALPRCWCAISRRDRHKPALVR